MRGSGQDVSKADDQGKKIPRQNLQAGVGIKTRIRIVWEKILLLEADPQECL